MLYRAAVLVFLVRVTDGVKVFCNATRPHGDVNVPQCFGPLGGAVECLASGEQRVSCSAKGDALRYGWSLDGNRTADTYLLSGSGATSHMTLMLGLSGVIKCSVSNDVSFATTSKTVSVCVDTTEAEAEDVTYADVSVLQAQGRQRVQRPTEVEYGHVKAATAPGFRQQTVEINVDYCLYSQPRKTRP
ncbi:hypothetical protein NHX12_011952 [Muraenolepis orangiensis]|uniref:Ig-like domain-containing protein n=1 Tax=Muraenolepis orangiensis TaxID=630683 RepID=A0A9Q0DH92_9TELE|nr:hypothetical protein NHX12_011952 [Muraenolepis orangiensis]